MSSLTLPTCWFSLAGYFDYIDSYEQARTSDSLNEGLPMKMTREKFQRKQYFFYEKIVGSTLNLSIKAVFSLDKYQLKIMG